MLTSNSLHLRLSSLLPQPSEGWNDRHEPHAQLASSVGQNKTGIRLSWVLHLLSVSRKKPIASHSSACVGTHVVSVSPAHSQTSVFSQSPSTWWESLPTSHQHCPRECPGLHDGGHVPILRHLHWNSGPCQPVTCSLTINYLIYIH